MEAAGREVRAHVAAERARVSVLVADLVQEALQTARKVGHSRLRERLALLRDAVERAIDVEERELVPLLRSADPPDEVEVAELRERHARVLGALKSFEDDVAEGHHHCDVVARAEELVAAFAGEIDEDDTVEAGFFGRAHHREGAAR